MSQTVPFMNSTSGRLMSFSISTALIGGGAAALMQQPTSLYVMAFSSFLAVVGCIASLQLALDEHPGHTLLAIIALPCLLFLYAVALGFVMNYYPPGAYAILALGAGAFLVALRSLGSLRRAGARARESQEASRALEDLMKAH